jgi:hypothetical protein
MTDRELLEAAAKAAGYDIRSDAWACGASGAPSFLYMGNGGPKWNPLEDDGDALRLACDLGLRVFPIARTESGAACSAVGAVTGERLSEVADISLDTRAATRRAIVRAAASISTKEK